MGVNLPARLVVIKGTRRYLGSEAEDASGYQEYERSTCLQAREWERAASWMLLLCGWVCKVPQPGTGWP